MNKKLILSWGVFAVVVIVAACLFFIDLIAGNLLISPRKCL